MENVIRCRGCEKLNWLKDGQEITECQYCNRKFNILEGLQLYKEDGNYIIKFNDNKLSIFPDWGSLEHELSKISR